jgi:hypothetical protein
VTTVLRPTKAIPFLALLAVLVLSSILLSGTTGAQEKAAEPASASAAQAIDQLTAEDGRLRFDVAEDMTRFVFAPAPVHDDGMPAHGNAFITQGYIYPEGTLTESNGVLPDGSPEFPDKVLGEWTCRGWFVGDGAHTTSGPWVITTQIYNLGAEFGDATLITEGYEVADVGVAIERAISGGTGTYAAARGDGTQVMLGFNATEGVNLRFALDVQSE